MPSIKPLRKRSIKNDTGNRSLSEADAAAFKELLAIHSPKIKQPQLENYHRQLRNLSYFVYRDANPIYIMQFETYLIAELVRLDISSLRDEEPELITERFLNFLYQEMPLQSAGAP